MKGLLKLTETEIYILENLLQNRLEEINNFESGYIVYKNKKYYQKLLEKISNIK